MSFQHPHPTPDGVAERPTSPLRLAAAHARHGLPGQLHVPETSLHFNLQAAARRFPGKVAIRFFDAAITYAELLREVEHIAGYLQHDCGIRRGDRVAVFSQNCPQFIAAYLAILRADAVFVPINAMLLQDELRHIVDDSGVAAAFVAQELVDQIAPLVATTSLRHLIVHAYGDALVDADADGAGRANFNIPEGVLARSASSILPAGAVRWSAALACHRAIALPEAGPDDLCMLPYTSGTTGVPKACMHTHRTVMSSVAGNTIWRRVNAESVFLGVAPLFHLLGLQHNVNAAIYAGGTIVLMPRWDRATAALLIERYRVTYWAALPAMLVDFFAQPGIEERDLGSLALVTGGGAATPDHINQLLKDRYGLDYIEGYGLTETAAFLCANPVHAPRRTCLGVPTFGIDLRVLDPLTLEPVREGEVGEIVAQGAQVMLGYWNNPQANRESFVVIDGKRFFRTGDLGQVDAQGYVYMRDRLKRMINASGFKVWPAEVEAALYDHPAIFEACVIAAHDSRRGETVKAIVALKPGAVATPEDIVAWGRTTMAAYKAPRIVEIVPSLPKSATGKIAWRELQDHELAAQPVTGGDRSSRAA